MTAGSLLIATTQPVVDVPPRNVQSPLNPKKKKSVPNEEPTLGLKNSVHPVQRSVAEAESCTGYPGAGNVLMVVPVNPNANCEGLVSLAPVPQRVITPLAGFV